MPGVSWFRCRLAAALLLCASPPAMLAQRASLTGTMRVDRAASGGDTIVVRIAAQIPQGWHIGAPRPGATGIPTRVTWTLPKGWRIASVQWPPSTRTVAGSDTAFEYRAPITIDARVMTNRGERVGTIEATVSYGICKDVCIPGWLTLRTNLR
jgi:thiol:disulfide interchange protein DsbD